MSENDRLPGLVFFRGGPVDGQWMPAEAVTEEGFLFEGGLADGVRYLFIDGELVYQEPPTGKVRVG